MHAVLVLMCGPVHGRMWCCLLFLLGPCKQLRANFVLLSCCCAARPSGSPPSQCRLPLICHPCALLLSCTLHALPCCVDSSCRFQLAAGFELCFLCCAQRPRHHRLHQLHHCAVEMVRCLFWPPGASLMHCPESGMIHHPHTHPLPALQAHQPLPHATCLAVLAGAPSCHQAGFAC